MTIVPETALRDLRRGPDAPATEAAPEREPGNGKKYSIWTIGCQMNESESAQVGAALELAGYRPAPAESEADVIVLNSCVVRNSAEQKVVGKLGALQRLKRANPDLKIALTGCMVTGQEAALTKRFPHVDLFFRPSAVERLTEIVPELAGVEDDLTELPHYYGAAEQQGQVTAFMPIIFGCNYVCSYCIIPYRRGKERSRPLLSVVGEGWMLAKRGVREITLLGQTVNAYGHDLPGTPDLADLLAEVDRVEGIERIRFLTSHPQKMTTKLIRAVADLPRVCEHINLPVQAGHDETLRRMRRNYTTDDYRRVIHEIRETIPNVTIATDIIVGFAGETEAQFRGRSICWANSNSTSSMSRCTRRARRRSPAAGTTTCRRRRSIGGTGRSSSCRRGSRRGRRRGSSAARTRCWSTARPRAAGGAARAATSSSSSTRPARNPTGSASW